MASAYVLAFVTNAGSGAKNSLTEYVPHVAHGDAACFEHLFRGRPVMSDHFNSFLMNEVLSRLEAQSFFTHIGEERTLNFVQSAMALLRYHDGNPGEALAGVGQRLGICYYCWDRGADLRQGICDDCRTADSIEIEPEAAATWLPQKTAVSYAFIRKETVRVLLRFLPKKLTSDLDVGALQKLPGNCIGWGEDVREIHCDSPWSADYLPGRRRDTGTPVLMIEMLSHPYPRVAQRLRRYASMLSESLCRSRSVEERPPFIMPMLLYNGLPAWTPRSSIEGSNSFDFTFVDVRRLGADAEHSYRLIEALASPETASRVTDLDAVLYSVR